MKNIVFGNIQKIPEFLNFGYYILIISIRFVQSGIQYSFQTDFFAHMMRKERLERLQLL